MVTATQTTCQEEAGKIPAHTITLPPFKMLSEQKSTQRSLGFLHIVIQKFNSFRQNLKVSKHVEQYSNIIGIEN